MDENQRVFECPPHTGCEDFLRSKESSIYLPTPTFDHRKGKLQGFLASLATIDIHIHGGSQVTLVHINNAHQL